MTTSNMAFIIGGSSGMGLATAKQLVTPGNSVIILGNNAAKLESAKTQLTSLASNDTNVETLR